jgi:hypothetical protein
MFARPFAGEDEKKIRRGNTIVNEVFESDLVQTKRSAKILNVLCVGWDLRVQRHELEFPRIHLRNERRDIVPS